MLSAYATGVIGLLVMLLAWVAVQQAWRKVFPEACRDPDVLAGRLGCRGPDCHASCDARTYHGPVDRVPGRLALSKRSSDEPRDPAP